EQDRRSFTVLPAGSAGVAQARLNDGATATAGPIVIDGRTTPINLGTLAQGAAGIQRTFTLSNLGDAPLTITPLPPPNGFSVITPLPASIAPNGTASFTVQLDSAVVGAKFGEVRFLTN